MKRLSFAVAYVLFVASGAAGEGGSVDFAKDVRPILERACWNCHGPDKQQGGLRFDQKQGALTEGDSGERAVVPGAAGDSELIRRIESPEAEVRMPLEAEPLSAEEIAVLRSWIDAGAAWPETDVPAAPLRAEMMVTPKDREHWAFARLHDEAIPNPKDSSWPRTPIDRFVLAALEAQGLRPNPIADRRTLIRRAYFDLWGLPPTPEEVASFVADPSEDAYERLVDRLLESPHYGERWGRHWLDVARYADSDGLETDRDRPSAFHYRDFVIRALNDDLSFQTFVRWQLAGDEYEPDHPEALSATGFLTAAPCEKLMVPMEEEKLRLRYNELDDMAATTMSAFLGLTLACARCHDHKFDAIPTRDYYRIQCAFTTTAREEVLLTTREEAARYRDLLTQWEERFEAAKSRHDDWFDGEKERLAAAVREAKIAALPVSDLEKHLLREAPDTDEARELAEKHEESLELSDDDYRAAFNDDQRREEQRLRAEVEAIESEAPAAPPSALAIVDKSSDPETTWLLQRGDFYARHEPVSLGFLTVLTGARSPDDYLESARRQMPSDQSTGQRRALAEWLTDVDQGAGALLARVMVNRLWQHHFGEGLVRTPGDFGVRGEPPTHQELMEWLAHDLVSGDWRLKRLHREIMTSAVYMQSNDFDAGRAAIDPTNRLLWRRRPRRLEAEILRDTLLQVSGTLNPEPFGPAFKPPIPAEAILARNAKDPYPTDVHDTPETRRRSVYMFHKRVVQHPFLQTFDAPDSAVSCSRRSATTVAPQALALLNDPFVRTRAMDLARRLSSESAAPDDWVTRGFWLALSRAPTDDERAACERFLKERQEARAAIDSSSDDASLHTLADLCQTLFGLNEFLYVD